MTHNTDTKKSTSESTPEMSFAPTPVITPSPTAEKFGTPTPVREWKSHSRKLLIHFEKTSVFSWIFFASYLVVIQKFRYLRSNDRLVLFYFTISRFSDMLILVVVENEHFFLSSSFIVTWVTARTARVEKDWTRTRRHYARRPISAHFTSMTVLPY
jgi:hypothetical protein